MCFRSDPGEDHSYLFCAVVLAQGGLDVLLSVSHNRLGLFKKGNRFYITISSVFIFFRRDDDMQDGIASCNRNAVVSCDFHFP